MKNIRIIILLLIIVVCDNSIQAQNLDKIKLDQYFQSLYSNNKFMGNVSIFHDGAEIYSKSVGFVDIDHQILNSKATKGCIGSISKTFTAVMTLKAIEAGKLSLSETIDKYFPTIMNAERITIEQLLGHRSGIHNYTENWEFMRWTVKTKEQMIDIIKSGGSDFKPDSTADYSNSNYVLLSYILETIYNKPYGDILTDQITQPLMLKNTYFGKNIVDIEDNECNSYLFSDKWQIQTKTDPSVTLGAGGIVSTAEDLNKFTDALFNGQLLSDNSLSNMLTMQDDYGMGIFPVPYFSDSGYGHRGGVDGFNSMLIYMPKDKISYAIISNGLNYNFTEIHMIVLNCIYGKQFDIPFLQKIDLKNETLKEYEGIYTGSELSIKITVEGNGESLFAQLAGQVVLPLEVTSQHIFKSLLNNIVIIFNPEEATMIFIDGEEVFYLNRKNV